MLEPGHLLAQRYRIQRILGEGGMATVYLARDEKLASDVAVKVLFPHLRKQELVVTRFKQEVISAQRVVHHRIIRIFDLVDVPEALFFTLEFVDGPNLRDAIRSAPEGFLSPAETSRIACAVLDGLRAAHAEGVIHRDIKPQNILLDPAGEPKIIDFGMARVSSLAGLTAHSLVLATPEYAAPEIFAGRHSDPRTDLYSVGALMYECLTGRLPFRGRNPVELIQAKREQAPEPISVVSAAVPGWLSELVMRAMAREADDRFQSATEMIDALIHERSTPFGVTRLITKHCRYCRGEMLETLPFCFLCSHEITEVKREWRHRYYVYMPSRWMSAIDHLTYEQKYQVVRLIEEAVRIAPDPEVVERRLKNPGVVVLDHLRKRDAERLRGRLRAYGVRANVLKRLSPISALYRIVLDPEWFFGLLLIVLGAGSFAAGQFLRPALPWQLVGAFLAMGLFLLVHNAYQQRPLLPMRSGESPKALRRPREVDWLVPVAKRTLDGIKHAGLKQTLGRFFHRVAAIDLVLIDHPSARPSLDRGLLEAALLEAGKYCRAIQESDQVLGEKDELALLDRIERLDGQLRRAAEAQKPALAATRAEAEAELDVRMRAEEERSRLYTVLLALGGRLARLHAEVVNAVQSRGEPATRALEEAVSGLRSALGLREVPLPCSDERPREDLAASA